LTFKTNVLYFSLKQLFKEFDMMVSNYNISNGHTSATVQERLLDAAEMLFCEKGFEGTSIRDITSEAGCNVAAVNYHFGGKEKLYFEVFHRHLTALRDARIAGINKVMSQSDGEITLEQLLRAFAMAFVEPLLDESRGRRLMKLMIREMLDSHLPKRMFADEMATPTLTAFGGAMARVCPGLEQKQTVMSMMSVIGQLLQVVHLSKMFSDEEDIGLPVPGLVEMVDHIVEFSAAGIRAAVEKIE
jgi:AcrR family transcriptional regulator